MPSHSARPAQSMPAAPHRQRKTAIACDSNGQSDVFGRPAVDDGARHGAHRLRPDRGRGGIAIIAARGHPSGQTCGEMIQCSSDKVCHGSSLEFRVERSIFGKNSIKRPSVWTMASRPNVALTRRGLVFPAGLVAGGVRLVEPDADIYPGHGGAGESQGVDKSAQRGSSSSLWLRRIVSAIKRDWLPPLVRRGQSRWGERVDLDRGEVLFFHDQSP